jgi:hypothetical protein
MVNVDNFVRAETDRMFASFVRDAGGVNRWHHNRTPTPLDRQPVIRMNRDTLYSFAVVDLADGATISVPDGGDRYVSVMIVNEDHYINAILHDAGAHELTIDQHGTRYVAAAARILVDPADADDVAAVAALQDQLTLDAHAAEPFEPPEHDAASLDATRSALLQLATGLHDSEAMFGTQADVDPVRHLIGTAAGWGGLPEAEAKYVFVDPQLPVGRYELKVRDVPVDGFWSISLYDADGYFPNTGQPVSINSVTADRDPDGSITVRFGTWDDSTPNRLPVSDGWNYLIRLYRPRPEVLDGSWSFPTVAPA